jgi:hypothetical protein
LKAGSPQYGYFLQQLARFWFIVSKNYLFWLIWDTRLQETFEKKNCGLEYQQEVLNQYNEPVVLGNIHIEDFLVTSQLTQYFCKSSEVL